MLQTECVIRSSFCSAGFKQECTSMRMADLSVAIQILSKGCHTIATYNRRRSLMLCQGVGRKTSSHNLL